MDKTISCLVFCHLLARYARTILRSLGIASETLFNRNVDSQVLRIIELRAPFYRLTSARCRNQTRYLLYIRVSQIELQTPQAADMTWKRAGSSPVGLQVTRTSKRHAWKAKPTTETENRVLIRDINIFDSNINIFELTRLD